jgi:hypothetical protein
LNGRFSVQRRQIPSRSRLCDVIDFGRKGEDFLLR